MDDPDGVAKQAEEMCVNAIERNRRRLENGFDGFILCSDYCFNQGPFLSPSMFRTFVTPYLTRITQGKLALCGNVHCAAMQTGTEQDVIDSCLYALKHGKPGGGYIFTTSNIPFKGMELDRYLLVLDVWKQHRDYTMQERGLTA